MKVLIITICLMSCLICSCHNTNDSSNSEDSNEIEVISQINQQDVNTVENTSIENPNAMARHDEIRKIMRDYSISQFESADDISWLSSSELEALHKMKEDYYYEVSDPNIGLSIPGPGWEIRGPLTIEQVEQEELEKIKDNQDVPQVPFGFINDRWNEFKRKYTKGSEIYYFSSDEFSWRSFHGQTGYVLIYNNELVDQTVTSMN